MSSIKSEVLDEIRDLQSETDPDILAKLVQMYLGSLPGRIASLCEKISRNELTATREEAHALKSSSASLGALQLSAICKEIEECAKTGAGARLPGLAKDIRAEAMLVESELCALPEMKEGRAA
jgi:HPt (histidine-containing phosphotransfer) domain-containing protein